MCNHYRSSGAWRTRTGEFSQLKIPIFAEDRPRPNVQGPDIWPGYTGEILTIDGDRLVAEAATWLFVPFWMKKSFKDRGADGKKPQYRFTLVDGRPFFFAGLRGHAEPEEGPMLTYTMVTKPLEADVRSIGHHRQSVILADDELAAWLDPANPIASFLEPSPAATFQVELARGVPA